MQDLNRKLGKRGQSARCVNGPQSRNLRKREAGQGLVEYVLVVVLMGLLAIGSLKFLGQKTHNAFKTAGDAVDAQTTYGDQTGQTSGALGG